MDNFNIPDSISQKDLSNLLDIKQQEARLKNLVENVYSPENETMENIYKMLDALNQQEEKIPAGVIVFSQDKPFVISVGELLFYAKEFKALGNEIDVDIESLFTKNLNELTMSETMLINNYFATDMKFARFCLSKYDI